MKDNVVSIETVIDYIENHLSFDSSFIAFAEKYYQTYDFVLLSTDVSEWSAYITKYYGLDKYFKHKIISGDVYCRKPDKRIYEITLNKAHKNASECLFIDDNLTNILSAKDILPAAAPLGSEPEGSVITIMLQVAATLLIVIKRTISEKIKM